MCGIAGILSSKPKDSIASTLSTMQTAIAHRGPDGKGDFISNGKQVGFAHTRLSIIDLSPTGHQPMSIRDGRYTITYNGEIYNYQQLRKRLEAEGETFQSQSDTEVILKMYATKGPQCVHFLRGMFAFVIWDDEKKTAFGARDPLGIKPLYYSRSRSSMVFASELRAIIASGMSHQKLSSRGLTGYFQRGTAQEPDTLIRDIKMLQAGCSFVWRKGKLKLNQYWKITFKHQSIGRKQAIELTRSALEDSVRAHFVSDVPVGIFLSGGIDSTALVALAKKVTDKRINTYTISFGNPDWNEGDIAKKVAAHFGTNHTEWLMTPTIAQSLFQDYLRATDQPSIDGFNVFCIAKLAHDNGEKVVLSGLGADELFAGYKSFDLIPEMLDRSARFANLGAVIRPLSSFAQIILPTKKRRMVDAISNPESVTAAHQGLRGIFSNHESNSLTNSILGKTATMKPLQDPPMEDLADQICALELTTYMRNQLLRDSDVNSMAWGLELRVPFVDKVLVDRLSTIPPSLRLEPGKRLLIDAIPELPEWIVDRPKQGFRFPFDEWFEDEWDSLTTFDTPKWIPLKPWYRRWSITALSEWSNRYVR